MAAPIGRLAILERSEPAVRVIRAAREHAEERARDVRTIVLHADGEGASLHVREADEAVAVGPDLGDLGALDRALVAVGADTAWVGEGIVDDPVALAALCTKRSIALVGPATGGVRFADPTELADAASAAGAPAAFGPFLPRPGWHRLEVEVVADGHGLAWSTGVRDTTLRLDGRRVIEESSSPALAARGDAELRAEVERFVVAVGVTGTVSVVVEYEPAGDRRRILGIELVAGGHPVTELTTGLDPVRMALALADGASVVQEPPLAHGHAIEVRLHAVPIDAAATPGRIRLLQLPSGPGVRVDAAVADGDRVPADGLLGSIVGWGRNRADALARVHRAVGEVAAVIDGAVTDKGTLLDVLARPEVRTGRYDAPWLEAAVAGTAAPANADLALLVAAIDAYDAGHEVERARFLTSARRGRPQTSAQVGRQVELRLGGHGYRLWVARTGRRHYAVELDGQRVDAVMERLAPHRSRISAIGRTARVVSAIEGTRHVVEVDGATHLLARDEGGIVSAPFPGVVVDLPVAAGARVEPGDTVAVIESMKMELRVAAPFAGVVRAVLVGNKVQVDTGAPLVQLDPVAAPRPAAPGPRVVFHADAVQDMEVAARCARNLDTLRRLVLGYDVAPERARAVADDQARLCRELPGMVPDVLDGELDLLGAYADLRVLFRASRDQADNDLLVRSPQEHLHAYLRSFALEAEGIPPRFRTNLVRALAHYGVDGLERTRALEDALFWIFQSQQRERAQVPVIVAMLNRWLERDVLLDEATAGRLRSTLDRLVAATQRNRAVVADLAREVRFRLFDEPVLAAARAAVYDGASAHLVALEADGHGPERDQHVLDLVACPQPLAPLLLARAARVPASSSVVLEVLTRRYYRTPHLGGVETRRNDGVTVLVASYEDANDELGAVVTTMGPLEALDEALDAAAAAMEGLPDHLAVRLDAYAWTVDPLDGDDALADALRARLDAHPMPRPLAHALVAVGTPGPLEHLSSVRHLTFHPGDDGAFVEDRFLRGLHPMMAERLHLWRLSNFTIERLPSAEDVYLFRGVAHANPKDERLFALAEVRDLTPVRGPDGTVTALPQLERALLDALEGIRRFQAPRPPEQRLHWNRVNLYVWPPLELPLPEIEGIARTLAPATEGLGIEEVLVECRRSDPVTGARRERVLRLANPTGTGFTVQETEPPTEPLLPLDEYTQKVVQSRRRGTVYPYELLRMLAGPHAGGRAEIRGGTFVEHDLDEANRLVPVHRPPGRNTASIVAGVITNMTERHPEGMRRVVLLGDPTRALGALAEPECRRIMAGLDLAEELGVPCEWFALSAGAKIAMDSGSENMDWISAVLRRIIEYTQAGGELNVVVTGINVGAQPYWNAEATMLMHTKGILVMTPESAMVLTGKQALDYSGGVSAEDNHGIGGYERVMGPNGQAQYWAPDLTGACGVLLAHYAHTYVVPGERFPRPARTTDPADRDVRSYPQHAEGVDFTTVGDIFSDLANPGRKQPFDIRTVMRAVSDQDHEVLERWKDLADGDTTVVWDAHVGGHPVCAIGIEGRALPRHGILPADGPDVWTSGTLFPISAKKVARAINAASGNRPLVVLANLSGFDGSPESMRRLQLEFGAEIGRAVVNFRGPIVFCVVSRFHGGAFVVFSRRLNEQLVTLAVEGSHASVIGGAPAAAVVFSAEVDARTRRDPRVQELEAQLAAAEGAERGRLRGELAELTAAVRSEMLGAVAAEYDAIHSVERAQRVGSVDRIIPAAQLRPLLIEAVEAGMAAELERVGLPR